MSNHVIKYQNKNQEFILFCSYYIRFIDFKIKSLTIINNFNNNQNVYFFFFLN